LTGTTATASGVRTTIITAGTGSIIFT
jgi:hypothetical protein